MNNNKNDDNKNDNVEQRLSKKITEGIDSLGEIIKQNARNHKKLSDKVNKLEARFSMKNLSKDTSEISLTRKFSERKPVKDTKAVDFGDSFENRLVKSPNR